MIYLITRLFHERSKRRSRARSSQSLKSAGCIIVTDITYIRLREEFVYLAVIMDVFTRILRGWSLGPGLGVELTLGALELAPGKSAPGIHHSDQGLQYAATDYTARLQSVGAQISMAEVGSQPRMAMPNESSERSRKKKST